MPILEKLTIPLNNQSPNDIVFVVEGTALCGAYLNELKQAYIIPTLEHFNGGSLDEKDSGSYSNFAVYGLVIFHAADVLPGYLTEAYGPIPTPFKVLTTLDKYQFTGGYGEAASHVGEGLATAMQCLQDISSFRNPPLEKPAKKHIILVCNCKPYGLPVTESVGHDGLYRGMTVELLASQMMERGIHLSIMSPRRIPALISLFDRGGGESSTQKTYARDPRHLVLLNGFHLQERPITPKQVSEVPAAMNPPPSQIPQQTPLPPPPPVPATVPQTIQHPSNIASQVPVSMNQSQASQINVAPPPAVQVQSSQPSAMPTPSSVPTSMQQSMASGTVSMAQSQNSMSPMNINQPMNNSMAMNPPQQNLVMIRNRAPLAMGNMRPMQVQNQLNPNQPMNPGQMNHPGQPISQAQQMTAGQQQAMNQQQQMMNQAQMLQNQQPQMGMTPQMNMPNQQQQQTMNQGMNPTSMNSQFPNQPQMVSQIAQQIPGQQMNPGMLGNPRLATSMAQQQQGIAGMQQQQQPGQPQQQPNQNMPRWPNQMQPNNPMQPRQPIPRMTNPNQQQVPSSTQPLQSQITNQQPISSPMQQMPQPNQQQQPMQPQQPGHSALLTQLNQPPSIPPKQPVPQTPQAGLMVGPSAINNQQKERQNIWSGVLEWHEKQRGPPDGKIPRQVPCKVSANVVNGEPEVKGDGWPTKLVMQLIPKHIVGSLGGSYLVRDVKTVVFMLQPCENLNSLTRVMDSGYAGCVHFTGAGMQPSACNIKVLILLYSKERATYLGFIPNDQNGFVDRIRKVIQQQKQAQQTTRQGQGFPGTAGIPAQPGMMQAQQPGTVQGQQQQTPQGQQGIVQAQPGGMLPQGSQPMVPQPGMVQAQQTPISSLAQQLGQSGPPVSMGQSPVSALAQQLGQAQQLQQQLQQQQQQVVQNASLQQGGMDSQNQGDLSQIDMERQQNLQTIQQLQQTLLAAQQREQMFQQLQHHPVPGQGPQQPGPGQIHVQVAQQQNQQQQQQQQQLQQQQQQQQQLQQQQQQQQQQVRPMMTQQNIGQMRMLRSSVSQANPGLKHLLQQQPGPQNYRMQMPMQQQQRMPGQMPMGAQMPGGPMQQNQQVSQGNQFEDVGILDLLK